MIVDIKAQKFMLSFEAVQNKCIEVNIILVPPCEVISLHHIIAKNAPRLWDDSRQIMPYLVAVFKRKNREISADMCFIVVVS